ncbi:hypothetical protein SBADM41S_12336 [Streptomyces badius]
MKLDRTLPELTSKAAYDRARQGWWSAPAWRPDGGRWCT